MEGEGLQYATIFWMTDLATTHDLQWPIGVTANLFQSVKKILWIVMVCLPMYFHCGISLLAWFNISLFCIELVWCCHVDGMLMVRWLELALCYHEFCFCRDTYGQIKLYKSTCLRHFSLYMVITAYHFEILDLKPERISSDNKKITHLLPPQ